MTLKGSYFYGLFGATIITSFGCAILAFGEPFLFFEHAFSDLGRIRTMDGSGNAKSFLIFAAGLSICTILMLILSIRYFSASPHSIRHRKLKGFFSALASIGILIAIFPHDIFHGLHVAGSAAMVGSLWMIANLHLDDIRFRGETRMAVAGHAVLQGTVVTYAMLYFIDSPLKQVAQKFAVMGLILVLSFVTNYLESHGRSRLIRASRDQSTPKPKYRKAG